MITTADRHCPKPGIYYGVPFVQYASWAAYNPSAVKRLIDDSPRAMRYYMDHGGSDSAEMARGRAAHVAVLEPDEFPRRYVLWDRGDRRGKAWTEFKEAHSDREILPASEYDVALAIRDAVRAHDASREIISDDGEAEVSIVWQDSTGLMCKGRIDWLGKSLIGPTRIVDLKTTRDHRPFQFTRQTVTLMYHVSLAAYADGIKTLTGKLPEVAMIAAGNAAPFDVVRYDLPGVTVRAGLKKWKAALQRIRFCEQSNTWPGYSAEPIALELPEWAMDEDEALSLSISAPASQGD